MLNLSDIHHVSVFANLKIKALGNPAGVVRLFGHEFPPTAEMAELAKQVGYPETAFVLPPHEGNVRPIRYFSQSGKVVAFCGHATMATAAVLNEQSGENHFAFLTVRDQYITASRRAALFELRQQWADILVESHPSGFEETLTKLGLPANHFWLANHAKLFVQVPHAHMVANFQPSAGMASILAETLTPGLVIFSTGNTDKATYPGDVVMRYFAPGHGIPEDPATGSVSLILARLLMLAPDKPDERVIFQASPRGGCLRIHRDRDYVYVRGECAISPQPIPFP